MLAHRQNDIAGWNAASHHHVCWQVTLAGRQKTKRTKKRFRAHLVGKETGAASRDQPICGDRSSR